MAAWDREKSDATEDTVFVLPLGATEQHGTHLPFETDTIIVRGICDRLIEKLGPQEDIRFLPVEEITYSPEHMDHTGSKTLTYDEAINRWIEIGAQIAAQGGRRFVLLNAHGGNVPLASIVAQELRVRHSMLAVTTKWDRFIKKSDIVSAQEEALGIHGGEIETSVMLALEPDQVEMERAKDFKNLQETLQREYRYLRAYGPHAFGWKVADLNSTGVTGNAGLASAPKGEALLEIAVEGLFELLQDVKKFDLSLLRDA